ncbi:hypothetical protein HII31_03527 [Pseudocercospora fuligena]|uniref:Uncharacterized protein n=1 Tax=Pseudocercospora fuligena TaxID=685502 RepID=A0A8H6VNV8_9PEZI|nr:hypothetical protein HII31_03527 [Pseudocercospora fuligena]
MSERRSLYLAKSRISPSQRAHFGIFYPHGNEPDHNLEEAYSSPPCKGTIIHVVGEPLMSGFTLQFKRNCDEASLPDLKELIFLGSTESSQLFFPKDETYIEEDIPRSSIERAATLISPPPKGQNLRLPIDGIKTKRCQEWTIEYIHSLIDLNLIDKSAHNIAEAHRDPPSHGIFGFKSNSS